MIRKEIIEKSDDRRKEISIYDAGKCVTNIMKGVLMGCCGCDPFFRVG